MAFPTYSEIVEATLVAIESLGGVASNYDIDDHIAVYLGLNEADLAWRDPGYGTVFAHRTRAARTLLKAQRLLDNPCRSTWALRRSLQHKG